MKFYAQAAVLLISLISSASAFSRSEDVISLLRSNDTERVERLLGDVQRRFESGALNEIELRNAFRPFYTLDATAARNLIRWAQASPKSYVAHLALGIYYKRLGTAARGENYIAETPHKDIDEMMRYFHKAKAELRRSLALTSKPYLSIFHLQTIAMALGDKDESKALESRADEILPDNALVRGRYAVTLLPRWGGSYAELDRFIASSKRRGVSANVISLLEAIEQDDMGLVLEEHAQDAAARVRFDMALRLGARAGATLSADFLPTSHYYLCARQNAPAYCQ